MYCPNCGVQINQEGAFCAKCRKDIAYLTKNLKEESSPSVDEIVDIKIDTVPQEDTTIPETELQPKITPTITPKKHGYYCNYCGTFVYPEDHYCYSCGKKTRPKYYIEKPTMTKKPLYIGLGAVLLIVLIIAGVLLNSTTLH